MEEKTQSVTQIHVYGARVGRMNFILDSFKNIVREFPAAHSLGLLFAKRNIKATYRQSMFGFLWAFLPPLATAFIWIILAKSRVVNLDMPDVSYPLFVITGTMLWTVFTGALLKPMQVMQSNRNILVKINFPRESLIISSFYETLFNLAVTFIIIIGTLIFFKVPLSMVTLLFFPGVLLLLMMGMAIGILLLPVSLLYRDIQFGLPLLLQFLMYMTPVVYALPPNIGFTKVLYLNPVSPVLSNSRAWLLGTVPDYPIASLMVIAIMTIFIFLFGVIVQRATIRILIERMGS